MTTKKTKNVSRRRVLKGAGMLAAGSAVGGLLWPIHRANADQMSAAQKWVDSEFQPSTLSKEDQMKEMEFFIKASEPYKGQDINVVSETIDTHVYESKTLAQAFREITGMNLKHDYIQEGDVVEKMQTQMQSGKNVYDMYVNDSDCIGTHFRYGESVPLSDFMAGEGKDVTLATLDVDDFIGKSFTTAPDGKMYQLPDQQFANLYWFRADWFDRDDLKNQFKAKYGYDLGVPINWTAYEEIANFFTNDVKNIDGVRVYGHMDYGKKDPSLGWRFTDAWLSMAGEADIGAPNGLPIDEWGIRVADDKCTPVGASVSRGGGTNSPAAVYALTKYIEWLHKYAPPEATGMTFSEAGPIPGQGAIAQQIFWYTAFTASSIKPDLPVMNKDGTPKWRMGPRAARPVLEGWHAERLPGRGFLDHAEIDSARASQGGLALRPVLRLQIDLAEEDVDRPDPDPSVRHHEPGNDRYRAEARRPGRVLPQPGARRLVADRHQRSRLSEAGSALVAERGVGRHRREDAAASHGQPCQGNGQGHGPSAACRHGAMRTEAQRGERPEGMAQRQGSPLGEACQ